MERQRNAAPVIIKRRKGGHGEEHHGGAWKIAFADFATAMMAFFLVMWLVNATTESQRKGLADYFNPSIPISRVSGGGDGAFGGRDIVAEETLANSGRDEESGRMRDTTRGLPDTTAEADGTAPDSGGPDRLAELAERLQARGGDSLSDQLLRHVVTRLTDEGLIVEMFDLPDQPLFRGDSDTPEPVLAELALLVAQVFALAGNGIAIEGHLRSFPVVLAENPVWGLSVARAQRMRGLLEGAGIDAARMHRLTGHADRRPAVRFRDAVRNNRLEVILLRDRA